MADQALTSLSTMLVGVLVARVSTATQFGVYALVFGAYTVALNISRAIATEPLTVRYSAAEPASRRTGSESAHGTALLLGLVAALVGVVATFVVPAGGRGLTLAFALSLPGLLVQDATRWSAYVAGRNSRAFRIDLVWFVAVVVGAAVLQVAGVRQVAAVVGVWGGGALLAALVAAATSGLWPRPARVRGWLREHRSLWPNYVLELGAVSITQQVYLSGITAVTGLAAVAGIRGSQILLGPVNVVNQGIGFVSVPEAVRAWRRSVRALWRVGFAVSAVISVAAAVWGAIFLVLPDGVGRFFVGDQVWTTTQHVLVPMIVLQVAGSANAGAYTVLRAIGAARRGLGVRLASSVLLIAGGVGGAVVAGAMGAAWGLAGAATVNAFWWWQQAVSGVRRLPPAPGEPRSA